MSDDNDGRGSPYKNDDTEESGIRLTSKGGRQRKSIAEMRAPRQRFCPRWETEFPWLKGDKVDESLGICTICKKVLVCKKSHLERHEKSFKHQRLHIFESGNSETENTMQPSAPEFLECGKRDQEDFEFESAIELDPDYSAEFEYNEAKKPKESEDSPKHSAIKQEKPRKPKQKASGSKLDRYKLLKRIDRDRQELNDYYYARQRQGSPPPAQITQSRDSFDLFFESVSASVKTLPPKLAAEVKGRVSQIIAEYELRAICERENMNGSSSSETAVVVSAAGVESDDSQAINIDASSGVPQIYYSFQTKRE